MKLKGRDTHKIRIKHHFFSGRAWFAAVLFLGRMQLTRILPFFIDPVVNPSSDLWAPILLFFGENFGTSQTWTRKSKVIFFPCKVGWLAIFIKLLYLYWSFAISNHAYTGNRGNEHRKCKILSGFMVEFQYRVLLPLASLLHSFHRQSRSAQLAWQPALRLCWQFLGPSRFSRHFTFILKTPLTVHYLHVADLNSGPNSEVPEKYPSSKSMTWYLNSPFIHVTLIENTTDTCHLAQLPPTPPGLWSNTSKKAYHKPIYRSIYIRHFFTTVESEIQLLAGPLSLPINRRLFTVPGMTCLGTM